MLRMFLFIIVIAVAVNCSLIAAAGTGEKKASDSSTTGAATEAKAAGKAEKKADAATSSDKKTSDEVIVALLKKAQLKYIEVPGKTIYMVLVKANELPGIENWKVYLNYDSDDHEFISMWSTMIDNADDYAFTNQVYEQAMAFNTLSAGAKVSIDKEKGDIDLRWDIPTKLASPEIVQYMLMDIALKCNTFYSKFLELAPASAQESKGNNETKPAAEAKPATESKPATENKPAGK